MAAVATRHCSPHTWLPSSWIAAVVTLHSCNTHAQLQSLCTSAITTHGRNPCARLQALCVTAVLVDGCNPLAWLQSLWIVAITLRAAVLMRGRSPRARLCRGGPGQVRGDWLQGLGRRPWGPPHTYLAKQPATTLPLPWAAGQPRDCGAWAWAGSGQQQSVTLLASMYNGVAIYWALHHRSPTQEVLAQAPAPCRWPTRALPAGSVPLSPAGVSLSGAAPQPPQKTPAPPVPLVLSTARGGNQHKGVWGKWSECETCCRAAA